MKQINYSRKIRQLDRLVGAMKLAMKERQPKEIVDKIRRKIALLVQQLRGILSSRQLVHKLGALAILFGLSGTAKAQTFVAPVTNPFGFVADSTGYIGGICNADFDDDGDMDVIIGGYYGSLLYFENTGTAASPTFGTGVVSPFGLTNTYVYAFLTTVDLDNDGDFDILAGEYYGALQYFENTGTPTNPAFGAVQTNPFGLTSANFISMPEFVDIDDDGDYDLFVGEYYGALNFFENTGTASSPAFASPVVNPFGLVSGAYFSYLTFGDLDHDGDFDLLVNDYYSSFRYYENTGTAAAPAFGATQLNPFGLVGGSSDIGLSTLIDIDDDGDLDVLMSAYFGNVLFFENTEFNASLDELENNISIAPNPFTDVIQLISDSEVASVEVYSVTGALVHQESSPSSTISLGDLKPGIYVIKATDVNGKLTQQKVEKL